MTRIIAILTLCINGVVFGQFTKSEDTVYLDKSWKIIQDSSYAEYYRITEFNEYDSILRVYDYFMDTKSLQMIGYYEGSIVSRSRQNGEFKFFYRDGALKAIYHYKSGIFDGEIIKYYSSGNIQSIETYDLGILIDTVKTFYSNGQQESVKIVNPDFDPFNPSEVHKKTQLFHYWDSLGNHQIQNGEGIYQEFFLNGRPKLKVEYQGGYPHGNWIRYTGKHKKIACKMTYKHGRFIKGYIYENGKKDLFSSLYREAYFPSGYRGLQKYVAETIGACSYEIKGDIMVLLSVTTQGIVQLEQIISGDVNACQLEELQMMVKNMPRWIPAVRNGYYVEGSYTLKITY